MSALLSWRRRAIAVALLVICSSGTAALSAAEFRGGGLAQRERQIAREFPPASRGPFGLPLEADGALSARWQILRPAIKMELKILAYCRADSGLCTSAASKFIRIIDAARNRVGRSRLSEINQTVNLAIRPMSDLAQYRVMDIWASPLMTFNSGAGDCEDYAIAKYVALQEIGMAPDDLRLVLVHDHAVNQDHMVVAARDHGEWLILDNRTMWVIADREMSLVTPLAALGDDGVSSPQVIAAIRK
jgi:predicted transglutaminase-like cysteine proteinase